MIYPSQTYGAPVAASGVTVAYTATAGQTSALNSAGTCVRVVSTTDCFIAIGSNPTAVLNTGIYLPAYQPEYFGCNPGDKVSAVQVSTAGSLYASVF